LSADVAVFILDHPFQHGTPKSSDSRTLARLISARILVSGCYASELFHQSSWVRCESAAAKVFLTRFFLTGFLLLPFLLLSIYHSVITTALSDAYWQQLI
jgi:hypothetical protein